MRTLYCIFLLLVCAVKLSAQTTNYQAYALFVVNFAKYSSWPETNSDFIIAVFGKSKVYDELVKQNGKVINGHTVTVLQVDNINEIGTPHILYLADGKTSALDEVVKRTEGKPVMIISEREGLFKKGAGFSFIVMENNTLRYDINTTDLEKRLIKVSKNLSSLANSMI
jgi:hypothetical protein